MESDAIPPSLRVSTGLTDFVFGKQAEVAVDPRLSIFAPSARLDYSGWTLDVSLLSKEETVLLLPQESIRFDLATSTTPPPGAASRDGSSIYYGRISDAAPLMIATVTKESEYRISCELTANTSCLALEALLHAVHYRLADANNGSDGFRTVRFSLRPGGEADTSATVMESQSEEKTLVLSGLTARPVPSRDLQPSNDSPAAPVH